MQQALGTESIILCARGAANQSDDYPSGAHMSLPRESHLCCWKIRNYDNNNPKKNIVGRVTGEKDDDLRSPGGCTLVRFVHVRTKKKKRRALLEPMTRWPCNMPHPFDRRNAPKPRFHWENLMVLSLDVYKVPFNNKHMFASGRGALSPIVG